MGQSVEPEIMLSSLSFIPVWLRFKPGVTVLAQLTVSVFEQDQTCLVPKQGQSFAMLEIT